MSNQDEELDISGMIGALQKTYKDVKVPDERPHINIVFMGHVDAGKSTTCGNILLLTGKVDARTMEKYEREAKEKNRESWVLAFIMDVTEEERNKGKTVEVGRAGFELASTRFTILDAPGHKAFIPAMLSGAAQADVGVLIVSARKGEFEAGFERGGQTREHALLAKTLGVNQLIVAINKMDDATCNWSKVRYDEIVSKVASFLKGCGFAPTDTIFVPISGLTGCNLLEHVSEPSAKVFNAAAAWYPVASPTFFGILETKLKLPPRDAQADLRVPLLEGFKEAGIMAVGKVESGRLIIGQEAMLMPARRRVRIGNIDVNEEAVLFANPGENIVVKLNGVDSEDLITRGSILCSASSICPVATKIRVQMQVLDLLPTKPLMTAGYVCVLHAHTASTEIEVERIVEVIDKVTKKIKKHPSFVKSQSLITADITLFEPTCLEKFADYSQLGRFTLRDESSTIAVGKVLEILSVST